MGIPGPMSRGVGPPTADIWWCPREGWGPTLLTSGGHHLKPVQTCSLEDLPPFPSVLYPDSGISMDEEIVLGDLIWSYNKAEL